MPKSILVVDDSPETREIIRRNLSAAGYNILTAPDVKKALKALKTECIDLVITDYKMPETSGLDLVRHVHDNFKTTIVMMITGYATVQGAVEAVKGGAEEYLSKPFTDEELLSAVKRSIARLETKRISLRSSFSETYEVYGLLGQSKTMYGVFKIIEKTSSSSGTVLITGESGTGKELVARAIHYSSPRAAAPFVPINCGAIPENLFEAELFGYMKGAFTGANESRAGFFQTAEGGSVFLDEVSELSPASQVKLLRVLQENEVCMLGSRKPMKLDVRIIAATNKDLKALVKNEAFREDLFYRLNVINIDLPPLRERGDDILLLTSYFTEKYSKKNGRPTPHISVKALDILKNYYWPGNIRELENVIQRIIVLSESETIDVPDLPAFMRFNIAGKNNFSQSLEQVQREHIANVLENLGGNRTKAAEVLGIDRKTLREKLKLIKKT
ncbi:MAG: sigma-54-dependent Fis family transcriptional regulator [Lentisphaerae bacterium GWF2_44_16]|nr:MAG: sigma-54-dependent Fis family transcriptional regulator [Lentisphaerae bacterium GWF2_44_16]